MEAVRDLSCGPSGRLRDDLVAAFGERDRHGVARSVPNWNLDGDGAETGIRHSPLLGRSGRLFKCGTLSTADDMRVSWTGGWCRDPARRVGLRDHEDLDCVLVCRRHLEQLRKLRPYEAERLARYLHVAFAPKS